MISKNKLPTILTTNIDPKQFGVSGTKQAINLYTSAISQQVQQSVESRIKTDLGQFEAQIKAEISAKLEAEYEAKFKAACIEHIIELNNQLKLERARMFGKKSEVLPIQDRLFNEAELAGLKRPIDEEVISDKAILPQPSQPAKPRNRGKRKPLSKELPRVEIIHDLVSNYHKAPLNNIQLFHTDRGNEFDNKLIDDVLQTFDIERSLSHKGCPYDNAVAEAAFKVIKTEFVNQTKFASLDDLKYELADYVNWYNNHRIHSTLGYLTPSEYKKNTLRNVSQKG